MTADQRTRVAAALAAGEATPTDTLQGLLLELGGEQCWRRPRLLHRLSTILEAHQPRMATSTTYQFKSAFRGKDFSGFPLVVGSTTKIITAANLSDEDVPLLQRAGGGHLIEAKDGAAPALEQIPDAGTTLASLSEPAAPANEFAPAGWPAGIDYEQLVSDVADLVLSRISAGTVADFTADEVRTVNSGILQTAVEQNEDGTSTVIKHSSGGPDDLPITAPAALQDQVVTPNALPEQQLAPAPPATAPMPVTIVPAPQNLHKLLKTDLQARYKEVLGQEAPADMLKDDLIKAIEAK